MDRSSRPIVESVAVVRAALKDVADANPCFLATGDKADVLLEIGRAEAQLAELRLRVLADAGDVAEATAARDAAEWLAHHGHQRLEETRADLRLAQALDRRYAVLARALRDGTANHAQARVVARALDGLPADTGPAVMAAAEAHLVARCADFGPRALARIGRRILDVVAPEVAEEAEARRLAELEKAAERKTRLGLRRLGDGTTRLSARLPDAVATRLATYLDAFTNPRKTTDQTPDPTVASGDPVARLTYPRRLGEAFCQLLECLDPHRLPLHGGDATTLVVTIDLDTLLDRIQGSGEVLGGPTLPGTDAGDHPTDDRITATWARRLACTAPIIPAVLGGDSVPLDLGRAQRLFSHHQRLALLLRDRTCRAEGCSIPGTWCEAHHWLPWHHHGPTDLANGALLCRHHHQRIHDPDHTTQRLPDGDIRFHRRR